MKANIITPKIIEYLGFHLRKTCNEVQQSENLL